MTENKPMKRKLIMQAFAPLFLILAIKNFRRELIHPLISLSDHLKKQEWEILQHILHHPMFFTYVLEFICGIWIVYALLSIRSFMDLQTANFRSQGEKPKDVKKISDSGIAFFMTYVLPMAMDEIGTLSGLAVFALLMIMLYALMWKTNLYYQNPILTILGYEVVSFQFEDTQLRDFRNKECIGITRGAIEDGATIKRQYIADNVFLIYRENTEERERKKSS